MPARAAPGGLLASGDGRHGHQWQRDERNIQRQVADVGLPHHRPHLRCARRGCRRGGTCAATVGCAQARATHRPASPRCSPPARIQWRLRAASRPRSATWGRTIGAGTCTIRSRGRTGSATRMPSSISAATRPCRRLRARTLGRTLLPHRGGQDLPAPLRRHDDQLRQGHGAAHLRGGRPYRPCHPAHALRAGAEGRKTEFFIEYFAIDLIMERGASAAGSWRSKIDDGTLHRFRSHLVILATGGYGRAYFSCDFRPHLHGRWQRHGAACRPAAAGHGIRAVPSHRHLRRGLPHHGRVARRGRLSHQLRGRALHGALRALGQGPCLARRRLARHDHGDSRRAGRRQGEGSHLSPPRPPRSEDPCRATARASRRARQDLRRRRRDEATDPGAADRALQHGRHPHELSRRGADQGRRRSGQHRAGADGAGRGPPASRSTGPTAWARTR